MLLSVHLSSQFEAAIDQSRRVIERIPDSIYDWKPHEKSWNTKDLATHIANLVAWGVMILTTDGLDFASEEMQNWSPPKADDISEVLALLDANAAQVRTALEGMSDAELSKEWVMGSGDQVMSAHPRHQSFASWVLAHQAHHRGELMVYLRLNDIPLPAIFGPTADEQGM